MLKRFLNKIKQFSSIDVKIDRILEKINQPSCDYVSVNKTHFKVSPHWFWDEFSQKMWEPTTYELMRKSLNNGSVYVDVGTWVGPTVLYAAELGAQRIFGIEANPLTYRLLSDTISLNKNLSGVELTNACVTNQDDVTVSFGGKAGEDTSSASSIRGDCWTVKSTTLIGYLNRNKITTIDLLKIDIEGAETLILKDLVELSNLPNLTVSLSLHPPMWNDLKVNAESIISALQRFSIFQADDTPIETDKLYRRMTTPESHPTWGTPSGNFFEIILRTRNDA